MYKLDLDEMYDWTVEEIEVFVRKWVSESQVGEAGLEDQNNTEASVAESFITKPATVDNRDSALSSEDSPIPPQNETPTILDEEMELCLANLALAAGLPKTDLRCRWVFPPNAGFLTAGDQCRSPAEARVHETNHPYFGPDDMIIKTCQVGHRYCVPTEMPDWECVRCRVDAKFPGWKPRGDIGVWDSVPADQRP